MTLPPPPVTSQPARSEAHGETAPIVRLVNVHKSFGPLRVLEGVSLDFKRGQTTVVVGPSGTGKSVLLKHIVGLIRPDQGEVYFDGQRIDKASEAQLVSLRTQIGFLFQMGALFDSMNVEENIMFPLKAHTKSKLADRRDRCAKVLRMVGLDGLQPKMPGDLSGGQRKRVALARAIVLEPKLILYDEPTTGLDPVRSDVINELIISLKQQLGISSIVVTHDMISADKVGDRMVMLHGGQVIADGEPEDFHHADNALVQRFIKGQAEPEDLESIRAGIRDGA